MDVVRHVLAARGAGGMMRGLAPTLVRKVAGTAIMFEVYEAGKRRLAGAQVCWLASSAWLFGNQ